MTGSARPASPCTLRVTTLRLASLRAREELEPSGESVLRTHLATCPGCLAEAVAMDPTLLFVRLSASAEAGESLSHAGVRAGRTHREEPTEGDLLAADVLAAIRVRTTEEGSRSARLGGLSRHWLRAAAVVLLASGLAAVLVSRRPAAPASERGAPPLAAGSVAPPRPLIEELASPGARVYEFEAATPREPTVVFVANPDADL
ncbi:MAG: hypothetical protein ACM3JH_05630 [Acidithiobacillales bacterium]